MQRGPLFVVAVAAAAAFAIAGCHGSEPAQAPAPLEATGGDDGLSCPATPPDGAACVANPAREAAEYCYYPASDGSETVCHCEDGAWSCFDKPPAEPA